MRIAPKLAMSLCIAGVISSDDQHIVPVYREVVGKNDELSAAIRGATPR